MPRSKKYPQKTIPRALLYIRILDELLSRGRQYVSSSELARMTGVRDVQIRKDISNFGPVGKPRVGYQIEALKALLEASVQKNAVQVVLFGMGHLGKAIARYPEFHTDKITIAAAFDKDKRLIGKEINGIKVYPLNKVKSVVKSTKALIGINAVPKSAAQNIANIMVDAGLKGIINFCPTPIIVPDKVSVKNIDLTIEFMTLLCDINP